MQRRSLFWLVAGLLVLVAALCFWRAGDRRAEGKKQDAAKAPTVAQRGASSPVQSAAPFLLLSGKAASNGVEQARQERQARLALRLSNTTLTAGQLAKKDHAILLANALIDTEQPVHFSIPEALRAPKDNGSYVVQASGAVDAAFRARLQAAGATIVSYIPNNAFLVRMSEEGAKQLSGDSTGVQAVLPYQPYYKLDSALLKLAVDGKPLPEGALLKVNLFADSAPAAIDEMQRMGITVIRQDTSVFGTVATIRPGLDQLAQVAGLPGAQWIEQARTRVAANDLTRTRLTISSDTLTNGNYLGLTGTNVLVAMADSGVDATHPDLTNRVFGEALTDASGHGTHVAGIIAGSGVMSSTVSNAVGSLTNLVGVDTNNMFRGMAPAATLLSLYYGDSDVYLQEAAASTNALISNNSWNYVGAAEYDLETASYDAAVRDALPRTPGSQPLLFVFPAGNDGNGDEAGEGGQPEGILSPGTAKNVITVGAIEQPRGVTNELVAPDSTISTPYLNATDTGNEVASFSSRGNVAIGIEGDYGRFKPDVVAPGTFVISDRSAQWDTNTYYNPTNYEYDTQLNQTVESNSLSFNFVYVPENAVGLVISVTGNEDSPSPFPDLPIYVKVNDLPSTETGGYDFVGTNQVSFPPGLDIGSLQGSTIFYAVGNPTTNATVSFDVTTRVAVTNTHPELALVMQPMNEALGGYYRYESGTSMSAATVSGMLALMQEFFEQKLHLTNSPALMKALLINGSRSINSLYHMDVRGTINLQGWGLPALANCIPQALTNYGTVDPNSLPLRFFDQSPTNSLATGQSVTQTLTPEPAARSLPMRITLVWSDPPGNPAASIKLVNDLDLVVTNLETGEIYFGNDIPPDSDFNQSWDTNAPPPVDLVNNVENVYLAPPLGSNYAITVYGRRVNVNAVASNTNDVVQDFALVMSSGNSDELETNAFTLAAPVSSANSHAVATGILTNGLPLLGQRVGANPQYAGSNGVANQWNFYVYTNTPAITNANFTNVAIVTFLPPEMSAPRMGTREVGDPDNATRPEADIDLYVSEDPALTNLNPAALAAASVSQTRTGTEKVLFSNSSAGKVYYIAVKSEDQEGSEFALIGVATDKPFGQRDENGNIPLTILTPMPVAIPDGSPALPGFNTILAVTTEPDQIRRVLVTDSVTHEHFQDIVGTLRHVRKDVTLHNHRPFDNGLGAETFNFDDSGEGDVDGSRTSDGPGSLIDFVGDRAADGVWLFQMLDDSLSQTGQVDSVSIVIEPQNPTNLNNQTIKGLSARYYFVDVPPNATNLTVTVGNSTVPLELYLRRSVRPTRSVYDKFKLLPVGGGDLSIGKYESPALNPGRYFIEVYNPTTTAGTFDIYFKVDLDLNPAPPYQFLSAGNEPILDNAVTYSTNFVGLDSRVVRAEVGVRIDHPRVSDLVLTLISPQGTRVLLAENRGGLTTNGYGSGVNITNAFPAASSGDANAATNVVHTLVNMGTLVINYDFHDVPDTMRIYYDGAVIFDSGLVSDTGTFTVDYGPGLSTDVQIVMNEGGNSNQSTKWDYTVTAITRQISYATFSEDTNFATVPIKFAIPPFATNMTMSFPTNVWSAGFETAAPGDFTAPQSPDGWTLLDTNPVKVVTVTALADTGTNVLALHHGGISRVLPTKAGRKYALTFVNHGRPVLAPVSWWKGETNFNDSADGNALTLFQGNMTYVPGVVGAAIHNDGSGGLRTTDAVNLRLTNSLSIEGWIRSDQRAVNGGQAIVARGDDRGGWDSYVLSVTPPSLGGDADINFYITDTNNVLAVVRGRWFLNRFVHVAGTMNGTNGVMHLYLDGVQASQLTTTQRAFGPMTSPNPCVGIGNQGQTVNNFPFFGTMDEITIYNRELSQREVQDIYAAGSAGKCPIGGCVVACDVVVGNSTNSIIGKDEWSTNLYSFTAPTDGTLLQVLNKGEDGMLLDSFKLVELPNPNPTNYFLAEESLDKVVGERSKGEWKLEIVDNRAGADQPPPMLVSWQLSLLVDTVVPYAIPLTHGLPVTNTVTPNSIVYFRVDVPGWAQYATNTLFNVSGGQVNLLFNQNFLPGTNASDLALLPNSSGGTVLLQSASNPPLLSGQSYFLGVQNLGSSPVSFAIEVDFNIITLTNTIPFADTLPVGYPRYFQYDVSTNAIAALFEVLHPDGDVDLVVRKGPPLPTEASFDYVSASPGTNEEAVYVITNSQPVALTAGRWYLGVFNEDTVPVNYAARATEVGPPMIIRLTNAVPLTFTNPPGTLQTNYFLFEIDHTNAAALFELYSLKGNVDLTLQRGELPYTPPYFDWSFHPGTGDEQIVVRTNIVTTNLSDLNGQWFLGVPNREATNVSFTIRAAVSTNGLLQSGVPLQPGITLPIFPTNGITLTWYSVMGEQYEIQVSTDLVNWFPYTTLLGTGPNMTFTDPTPLLWYPYMFYRIVQVPTPP